MMSLSSSNMNLPTRFHLSASMLSLVALMALVGTHSMFAEAASISHYGLPAIESSMAMYYQPGVIDTKSLCPPDFDGAYIAAGCKSFSWCTYGMLKFQDRCPEGQLFDDKCLCCRDDDKFECRVNEIPAYDLAEVEDDDAGAHTGEALVATDKDDKNDKNKNKNDKNNNKNDKNNNKNKAKEVEEVENKNDKNESGASGDCVAEFTGISTNSDCTAINVCDQGKLTMSMDCPTGTLFDDNTKNCVKWHRQFVCIKSLVEAKAVEIVENSPDCPQGASGLSPLTDCVGYNVCFFGTKLFDTQCGTGFLFNVNTLQCERWYRGFVCPPKDVTTPNSSQSAPTQPKVEDQIPEKANVSPRGTCPSGHNGFAPTPDCRSTNVCRGGVFKYALDCEVGQLFDLDLGRCVNWYRGFVCGGDVEADRENNCPKDYTGMIATPGCSGSYVCRQGKILMGPILCPSGTFFDGTTASCEEKYDDFVCAADEAGTRTQDTAAPTTSPLEAGPCRSGFTGLTATDQCEGANVCRDGNYLTSIDCPNGSLFDVNVQQCVPWYRNFVCGGIVPYDSNEDDAKDENTDDKNNDKDDKNNDKNKAEEVEEVEIKNNDKDDKNNNKNDKNNNKNDKNNDKEDKNNNKNKAEEVEEVEIKNNDKDDKNNDKDDKNNNKDDKNNNKNKAEEVEEVEIKNNDKDDKNKNKNDKNKNKDDKNKNKDDKNKKDDATGENTSEVYEDKSAVVTDALVSPVPMPPPMRPRSRCPKGFSGKVPANEDCSAYIFCERGQYDNLGVVPCRPDDRYVFDFLSQSCKAFGPEEHFECIYTILTTDEEALAEELIAQLHND